MSQSRGQAFAAANSIERSRPLQRDSRACLLCQRNILGKKPQLRGFDRPRKRACLTAIHNFFLTRSDGTTAAERFFAQKPRSMFASILRSVALPLVPLSPPRRAEGENGGGQRGRYRDQGLSSWEVLHQRYHRPFYGSGGFEGLPLDFDDAEFYRRFDSFSKSGRQIREEGRDHGAILPG